jgi:uncharacterized lipoprotein YmbA
MRYIYIATAAALMAACSSSPYMDYSDLPNSKMLVDKEMLAMTRSQIITAVGECRSGNMRPVMVYSKRKINGQISDAVVDVTCSPKFGGE